MKETYLEAKSKRIVQDITLNSKNKRIIGLGGPDILEYVTILKSKGFKDITSYENRQQIYSKQFKQFPDCELVHGNILENLQEDAFYDLDFCCSIKTIEPWLPIICRIPEYSLTLSIRPVGIDQTIQIFKRYGQSQFVKYVDTVPMLVFFNNKINKNGKKTSSFLHGQGANTAQGDQKKL